MKVADLHIRVNAVPVNDPANYNLFTYAWVVGLSVWGGLARYLRKLQQDINARFSLLAVAGEIVSAGLTGLVTFWLCTAAGMDQLVTAAMVAISGHMGSTVTYTVAQFLKQKLALRIQIIKEEDSPSEYKCKG